MSTTQNHLSISDVTDNILLLKDGSAALVLQVSAVNFGLLSDREQMAIIISFAQMLNSLSFSIQIIIHSERLNITSYLTLLEKAQQAQTNPLLALMMTQYKQFIQATIKENEVLDKKFYLAIPLFNLELGLTTSKEALQQKIKTVLLPRRDQIIRQLSRVGLKANQLSKQQLIELFYDIYNGQIATKPFNQLINPQQLTVKLKNPQPPIQRPMPPPQPPAPAQPPASPTQPASQGERGEPQSPKTLYHIDLYRLDKTEDFHQLGLNEILANPNNIILIEWAEKIKHMLPEDTAIISFKKISDSIRRITIKNYAD